MGKAPIPKAIQWPPSIFAVSKELIWEKCLFNTSTVGRCSSSDCCLTSGGSNLTKAFVCFCKHFFSAYDVEGPLFERLRVPFTPWHGEEITAIDMDCRCYPVDWIRNRMNDGFAEGERLFNVYGFSTVRYEPSLVPTKKGIVLSPAIDPNHRPHSMVVRVQSHARSPQDVKNRQGVRLVKRLDARNFRLPERLENLCRFAYRPGD